MPVSYSSGLHTHEMHHIPHATICTAFMPSAKLTSSPAFARKTRSGVAVPYSAAHRAVSMSAVRELTGAEFEVELQDFSTPLLVDVYATWCVTTCHTSYRLAVTVHSHYCRSYVIIVIGGTL
eukprot:5054-Heterococcus_DN1.PRE.2